MYKLFPLEKNHSRVKLLFNSFMVQKLNAILLVLYVDILRILKSDWIMFFAKKLAPPYMGMSGHVTL